MTIKKANEWQGPFESRKDFEVFQDRCVQRLVHFALDKLQVTVQPEEFKAQLWDVGRHLPAATLGLARHNLEAAKLFVWENGPSWRSGGLNGTSISDPTELNGQAAYDCMMGAWADLGKPKHARRFSVQAKLENSRGLELVYSGERCLLLGRWTVQQHSFLEHVAIPDTSRLVDLDAVSWEGVHAGAGDCTDRRGPTYAAAPFTKPMIMDAANVHALAGGEALDIFQKYGGSGLYQYLLWSRTRKLLANLDSGLDFTASGSSL